MEFSTKISNEIHDRIKGTTTDADKVIKIFQWIYDEFEWIETEYVDRTVEEVIKRKAGNCAEHTKVVNEILHHIGIKTRWIFEINSHPESIERQKFSSKLIKKHGEYYSVFGFNQNDHRWLEYFNTIHESWLPVGTSFGVLGIDNWIEKRLGFSVDSIPTTQNIIPFCIVALDSTGAISKNLSKHYLIDQFNRYSNGKLKETTVWEEWVYLIDKLTNIGIATYKKQNNLHKYQDDIKMLTSIYFRLKQEITDLKIINK